MQWMTLHLMREHAYSHYCEQPSSWKSHKLLAGAPNEAQTTKFTLSSTKLAACRLFEQTKVALQPPAGLQSCSQGWRLVGAVLLICRLYTSNHRSYQLSKAHCCFLLKSRSFNELTGVDRFPSQSNLFKKSHQIGVVVLPTVQWSTLTSEPPRCSFW